MSYATKSLRKSGDDHRGSRLGGEEIERKEIKINANGLNVYSPRISQAIDDDSF
jgi:hypothetical protein